VFLVDHSDAIHLFFLPKNKAVSIVHDQFAYLASKNKIPGVKIGILGRVYQLLIHQGLLRSRKLLPVSEYTKNILTELGVKSTMEVLRLTWNPWHDESSEISKMHVLPKKYALLVSPSSWRKNRVQAFNVMIEIRKTKELENLELIVIGDPITESESAFFNKSEIGFIHFKQNISEIDLKKIYDHAIFCLVISKYEGLGLPILEANSRGIRCLHNQLPSFMEITNLENIILEDKTDSNNWILIANSINQFVASRSLSIETANRFGYDVFLRNLKNQLPS